MRRYVEQIVVLRSPQVFEGVNLLCCRKRIQNEHVAPLNGLFYTGDEKKPVIFRVALQIGIVGESIVIRNGNGFETLLGKEIAFGRQFRLSCAKILGDLPLRCTHV